VGEEGGREKREGGRRGREGEEGGREKREGERRGREGEEGKSTLIGLG